MNAVGISSKQHSTTTHVAFKVFINRGHDEVLTVPDLGSLRTFIFDLQDHVQLGSRPFSLEVSGTALLGVKQSKFDDAVVSLVVYEFGENTSSEIKNGSNPKLEMVLRDEVSKYANFGPETKLAEFLLDMLEEFFAEDLGLSAPTQT